MLVTSTMSAPKGLSYRVTTITPEGHQTTHELHHHEMTAKQSNFVLASAMRNGNIPGIISYSGGKFRAVVGGDVKALTHESKVVCGGCRSRDKSHYFGSADCEHGLKHHLEWKGGTCPNRVCPTYKNDDQPLHICMEGDCEIGKWANNAKKALTHSSMSVEEIDEEEEEKKSPPKSAKKVGKKPPKPPVMEEEEEEEEEIPKPAKGKKAPKTDAAAMAAMLAGLK